MDQRIPETAVSRFSKFVSARMGLNFPDNRRRDLEKGIVSASREFNFGDPALFVQWIVSSPFTRKNSEVLASHLTVGETYFFRERGSFEALEGRILPQLVQSRLRGERRLRLWNAGCSTGEEPYSMAILLRRMIFDLKDWNITILATDINPHALRKAAEGVYGEWSFRSAPRWLKERYFKRTRGGGYEVLPEVKKMVRFAYHNLVDDPCPSLMDNLYAMDIVFCCNVLMYFTPECTVKVVQNFSKTLVDGGCLVLGPNDPSHLLPSEFVRLDLTGAAVFKKEAARSKKTAIISPDHAELVLDDFGVRADFLNPNCFPAVSIGKEKEAKTPGDHPASPYEEALSLYKEGRYAEAAGKLENRRDAESLALLARVYANQGKLGEACECCCKAISAERLSAGYHYLLATILQEQGRVEEAVKSLKRVLYLDNGFVLAHIALGNITRRMGRLKESDRHFENALALLSAYPRDEVLPESEGMSAGRLMEIIMRMRNGENGHGAKAA